MFPSMRLISRAINPPRSRDRFIFSAAPLRADRLPVFSHNNPLFLLPRTILLACDNIYTAI